MSSPKAATTKTATAKTGTAKPATAKAGARGSAPDGAAKQATAAKPAVAAKPPASAAEIAAATAAPAATAPAAGFSADATRLAAEIERAIVAGNPGVLDPKAVQALMAAMCRLYGTQVEAGQDFLPLEGRSSVSPTEVMTTTSGLLRAANLAVFELGMWQSWTGR